MDHPKTQVVVLRQSHPGLYLKLETILGYSMSINIKHQSTHIPKPMNILFSKFDIRGQDVRSWKHHLTTSPGGAQHGGS